MAKSDSAVTSDEWAERGARALFLVIAASGACVVGIERGAWLFALWAGCLCLLFVGMLVYAIHGGVRALESGR
jgi:hypothetical protein